MRRQSKKLKKSVKKATKNKNKTLKKPVKKTGAKKQTQKVEKNKKQVTKKPASKISISKKVSKKELKRLSHEIENQLNELMVQSSEDAVSNVSDTKKSEGSDIAKTEGSTEEGTTPDVEILELEKKKKTYWSDDTEKYVVEFLNNDCNYYNVQLEKYFEECKKNKIEPDIDFVNNLQDKFEWASQSSIIHKKEKIYKDHIHKPLNRLVENIIFNFKLFRQGVDIKTLQADCLSFVYSKFSNFNPDKNTKSFSFFGTIAKHYLMGEKKENDKSQQVNLDYDDHKEEADGKETTEMDEKSDLDSSFSLFSHVIDSLEKEIQKKLNNREEKKGLSENDLKVADAIVHIFKTHELLGAYNKNHVYYLIKEHTGLQTKDITYSLGRFRVFYRLLKQDFIKQNADKD